MKNLFNKFSVFFRVAFCSAMVALTTGGYAFAQSGNLGSDVLGEATSATQGLVLNLVRFLQVALGLGALITLILAVFNLMKGEREAAQKIGYWVVGLAIGFALLSVIATRIQGV